jgi:hypothetical protein
LVRLGHDVTLFASGDSLTTARLVPACKKALRLDSSCVDQSAHHVVMLDQVFSEKENFDLIHFHVDYFHFPFSRRQQITHVTTLHGRLDLPDLREKRKLFFDSPSNRDIPGREVGIFRALLREILGTGLSDVLRCAAIRLSTLRILLRASEAWETADSRRCH